MADNAVQYTQIMVKNPYILVELSPQEDSDNIGYELSASESIDTGFILDVYLTIAEDLASKQGVLADEDAGVVEAEIVE